MYSCAPFLLVCSFAESEDALFVCLFAVIFVLVILLIFSRAVAARRSLYTGICDCCCGIAVLLVAYIKNVTPDVLPRPLV